MPHNAYSSASCALPSIRRRCVYGWHLGDWVQAFHSFRAPWAKPSFASWIPGRSSLLAGGCWAVNAHSSICLHGAETDCAVSNEKTLYGSRCQWGFELSFDLNAFAKLFPTSTANQATLDSDLSLATCVALCQKLRCWNGSFMEIARQY